MSLRRQRIRQIARRVRSHAEVIAEKTDWCPQDLTGFCAIAAQLLFRELKEEGFQPELAVMDDECEGHCFIICHGLIVDVTASQFQMPKVCVRSLAKAREAFWQPRYRYKTMGGFLARLRRDSWPDEQRSLVMALAAWSAAA